VARRRGHDARFIPAPAGNTWSSCRSTASEAVHPRSRGEHPRFPISRLTSAGSSPLPRGTRTDTWCAEGSARFIPAPAGNTHRIVFLWVVPPVHPRSRGEHRNRNSAPVR